MSPNDIDYSQIMDRINDTVDEMQDRVTSKIIAEHEYKGQLENCIFETRDALRKMQEDSEKESKYNHKINIIIITIATLTLIATVIPIVISLFL